MKEIIDKAVEGGFDFHVFCFECDFGKDVSIDDMANVLQGSGYDNSLYFRHDFLKAFFGEDEICGGCGEELTVATMVLQARDVEGHTCDCGFSCDPHRDMAWMYHARELVLSEDRLEYLRRFLND